MKSLLNHTVKFDNFDRQISLFDALKMAIGPVVFMVIFFGILSCGLWFPF